MDSLKLMVLLLSPMIMFAHAEKLNSEFEAKVNDKLEKLAEENTALNKKLESMEKKLSALEGERTYEAFDCYRDEDWDIEGTITFNSCSGIDNQHSD